MNDVAVQACGLVFAAMLAAAAVTDLRKRIIPNMVPAVLAAAFLPAAWWAGYAPAQAALHVGAAAVVFVVAVLLFVLRAWGGGDAKLAAAAALWIGFAALPRFVAVMALAGGLLAVVVLLTQGRTGKVPYGVAIAAAGLDWWYGALLSRGLS